MFSPVYVAKVVRSLEAFLNNLTVFRLRLELALARAAVAVEQGSETDFPLDSFLASGVLGSKTSVAGTKNLIHLFEGPALGFWDLCGNFLAGSASK